MYKYNLHCTHSRMREIIQAIETIRERIDKHKTALSGSEAMTRYAPIDPMLRALDWDVSDPDTVTPEDAGTARFKIDYTMGSAMVVEAKKFGERLDRHADQLIEYARASKVRYGVLTNGQRWRMYDSRETMSAVKVEFDVTDPAGIAIQKSAALHRRAVSERPFSEPASREQIKLKAAKRKRRNENSPTGVPHSKVWQRCRKQPHCLFGLASHMSGSINWKNN